MYTRPRHVIESYAQSDCRYIPSSPTTNARLGIRIQAVYSKVEGVGNIPGSMEPHSTLAKGRDRNKRKTSWSHRDRSEWSTSDSRDWETRTHGMANHINSLIAHLGRTSYRIPTNPEPCNTHGSISDQPTGSGSLQASIRGDLQKASHYIQRVAPRLDSTSNEAR